MFNSILKSQVDVLVKSMASMVDQMRSFKRNYADLKVRLDGQITHFNQENQSLRDKNEQLRNRLAQLEKFLGVEYFQETAKGYRKVKVTRAKKTK